ncbi:MAG: hypothetical protein B6U69_02385 [Thermofilum sp. ex4484_15]|nr:MAG: hypothetical protein B6U69_02385 [Thermofilum sp. ex4484_15]
MAPKEHKYDNLLRKVYELIKSKGEVNLDELLKWVKHNEMGPFTLSMILEDLRKKGLVQFSGGTKVVEDLLGGVELPLRVSVKISEAEVSKRKKIEKREKEDEGELSHMEDGLYKAIRYLNRYWSVGEIRFSIDLKAMGVRDVRKILRKLLELGYITVSELGVINATEKLPKVDGGERLPKELADILKET